MTAHRVAVIRDRLTAAFSPRELDVADDSHRHIGHAGAADGRGHFRVRIVSERFADLRRIERHRLVYEALGDLMQSDIHALQITALTPDKESTTNR